MTLCQKDMASGEDEIYTCPYCIREPYPGRIGKKNLINHIRDAHPEKYKEFMDKGDFNMTKKKDKPKTGEKDVIDIPKTEPPKEKTTEDETLKTPPKEKTPPADQNIPPIYQEKPRWQVEEPEEWLESFLRAYKFREMFIRIQVEQVRQTKELPYAGSLFQDMETMDSGVTNKPTISWIVQQYERQVKQYMKKYEELMNAMTRRVGGYPIQDEGGGYRDTYRDTYRGDTCDISRRGIPVGEREQRPQQRQSYYENERVMRLEDMIRRRDEEARLKMESEYNSMKMKIDQGLTRQEDPALIRLQQQLAEQAAETKRLTADLAAQEKTILLERIARVEQNVPGADQIKAYIENSILAHDDSSLDRRIKDAINASQGVSKTDVDMKKIDRDYEIATKKLDVEAKKGDVLGETLKEVAGLFGEGLGKGMSGAGQPPDQSNQTLTQPPVACPHCDTPLLLPPGVHFGICPSCKGKMEIGVDGTPRAFAEQPQQQVNPQQQPPITPSNIPQGPLESNIPRNPIEKKPKAERLGICPICGQPVYDDNIGKTENGKPYHKECC